MSRAVHLCISSLSVAAFLLTLVPYASAQASPSDVQVIANLPYREGSSKQWRLDLARKKEKAAKPRPAIVVIHGGGWIEGDKSSFTSRKHGVPGNIEDFAELGFVAATINYRLADEAPYPAALDDCKAALRWLRAHAREYNIDVNHIGVFGNSAGGHLALLLGLQDDGPTSDRSSLVQAVVSDSGPVDLLYQDERGPLRGVIRRLMGGPPDGARAAAYKQASPGKLVKANVPPLLLIYGVADEQVPVETADEFVLALGKAGVADVTYHRLAYVGHCPYSLVRLPLMKEAVKDFFMRTLMHPETAQQVIRRVDKAVRKQ